jgi:UDP-glucose 4-epimerase
MKIMVTGGTSFIGCHVVKRLAGEGHQVTILARDPAKVPGLRSLASVDLVPGTLTSPAVIEEALRGKDACIHIALGWGDDAVGMAEADTLPAIRIFQAAADLGVRHLIYTSSVAVFDSERGWYSDTDPPRPARFYGATKAATEVYVLALAAERSLRANVIRPGYTFGNPAVPGAPIQSMPELPEIARKAAHGEPITVARNAGLQFIWAGDLARIYSAVLGSAVNRALFTSLSPDFITWEQIARWAVELCGSASEVSVADADATAARIRYDVSAIGREFDLRFNAAGPLKAHLGYLLRTFGGEVPAVP